MKKISHFRTRHIAPLAIALAAISLSSVRAEIDPMTVSAGDVRQTTAVLWAHSAVTGLVKIDYSTDPTFTTGVTSLNLNERTALVPVKADIRGLKAATTYYYRATGPAATAGGRFRTAEKVGAFAGLHFGVSGDERGELAPYPSVRNAPDSELDFFLQFGDNIYADFPSPDVPLEQCRTLTDFRLKTNEVYSTRFGLNTLAELRSSTAILATIDDHEVTDNFAGAALRMSDPRFSEDTGLLISDTETFLHGLRAFHQYHPVHNARYGDTGDYSTARRAKTYRFNTYGNDAAMFVLDARSFRSPELPPVTDPNDPQQVAAFLVGAFTPGRTMLGAQQLADLKQDLARAEGAGILWKFILCPEPVQNFGPLGGEDRYEGYAAERTDLLQYIQDTHITNVVFVTADFHGTLVNRLSYQLGPFLPQIQTDSIEIVTGPVAFDKPFGPTIVDLATAFGLITPEEAAYYYSLPNGPDKEGFVLAIVNGGLAPLGYNLLSLTENPLPNVELVPGQLYESTNTYGWTEFNIDQEAHQVDVKTWGILPYSQAELEADPDEVTSRTPEVVSDFTISPLPDEPYVPPGVTVIPGDFVYVVGTGHFLQGVELRNDSNVSVPMPLSLILDDLSANAILVNSTGATTVLPPLGSPYLNVIVPVDGVLNPGNAASVTLEFAVSVKNDPRTDPLTYTPRVAAGSPNP